MSSARRARSSASRCSTAASAPWSSRSSTTCRKGPPRRRCRTSTACVDSRRRRRSREAACHSERSEESPRQVGRRFLAVFAARNDTAAAAETERMKVIKLGGSLLDDAQRRHEVLSAMAAQWNRGEQIVLVHGGGKHVDARGEVVRKLHVAEAHALLNTDVVSGGMRPKLMAALHALGSGVCRIEIGETSVHSERSEESTNAPRCAGHGEDRRGALIDPSLRSGFGGDDLVTP